MKVEIAERFAKALDAEQYDVAFSLLDADCRYTCRGQVHEGAEAIIDSYRVNGDEGNKVFDRNEYESEVRRRSDSVVVIRFRDHLWHRDKQLTFECEQEVEVNAEGLISQIRHVDLPGQVEALREFKQRLR